MGVGTDPLGFSVETLISEATDNVAMSCARDSSVALVSELSDWRVTVDKK